MVSTRSRAWLWQVVLLLPSLWCLLCVPPLWRDTDGFNQIASTFAPKGIIHWLPGYCFCGRLVVIAAGIVASLVSGHGLPYLSIGNPQLSDAGIYALLLVQQAFLFAALTYLVRTFVDGFWYRLGWSVVLALTPWMYTFANCIGSEAFSNPLVLLVIAVGWRCFRAPSLTAGKIAGLFGLVLAACLTRQINLLLAALLPLSCLFLGLHRFVLGFTPGPVAGGGDGPDAGAPSQRRVWPDATHWAGRCALFGAVGAMAVLGSLGVQRVMCALFRVPYRSTFGETFEWRLNFLKAMPGPERARLLGRIAEKLDDPVITKALQSLDASINRGEQPNDMFLYYALDEDLDRAGLKQLQARTYQIDLKLNRLARQFILSADPYLLRAIRNDFLRVPMSTQPEMAESPFETTDMLIALSGVPRYARLRALASFQHPPGFFTRYAHRTAYLQVLGGVPMLSWAVIAAAGAFMGWWRRGAQAAIPVAYSGALVVTGLLIALGTCASTFFGARLYLPVYSLFEVAALLMVTGGIIGSRRTGTDSSYRPETV
ncbi:MAG: hypothetical protein JO069_09280 [Verrucomicrobia bacterium]|nr:hypothetical protein [Verrucomicrobiota bacterium]